MKQPASRELFNYWNELRGDRTAPERGDIDPAVIRNVLADTFMLDVDLAAGFPFRLAGTRVNGLFEAEQKGLPFLSLWRAAERRNLAAVLLTVADGACPVVSGAAAGPKGQPDCDFELLFLPLRHYGKTHSRILGLIRAVAPPEWLGLLPIGPLALRSLRIVDTSRRAVPERIAVGQEVMAPIEAWPRESQPVTSWPVETPPATRPYLRVIQGGL